MSSFLSGIPRDNPTTDSFTLIAETSEAKNVNLLSLASAAAVHRELFGQKDDAADCCVRACFETSEPWFVMVRYSTTVPVWSMVLVYIYLHDWVIVLG